MWTSQECFGLHGHVKIAPNDGTVYVPNKACGSPECLIVTSTAGPNCHPGFAESTDNGVTWNVHTISDMHTRLYDTGDPSIAVGANGTMYFAMNDRDGHPKVAVCTNQGTTCGPSTDVGLPFHIENTEMPTVVAGDDNRAAFVFLGSTTPGDDQENAFVGTWDVYVAVTYDGGAHWTTTDATPGAPIERGCIEFNANCPSSRGSDDQRNLLDFNDLTIDHEGRIVAAYTDGCQQDPTPASGHGPCATDATRLSGLNPEIEGPAILRQTCGIGLLAAFDTQAVACAPSNGVPEVSKTGLLAAGGMVMIGVAALVRRRRRRPAAAA
jgi:MYXO-CTERM domain-containing protein